MLTLILVTLRNHCQFPFLEELEEALQPLIISWSGVGGSQQEEEEMWEEISPLLSFRGE